MSYLKISQSLSIAMATLILGYFSFGVHGLILGNLIGMLIFEPAQSTSIGGLP